MTLWVCVSFSHHRDEIVLSYWSSFPLLVVQGASMLSIKCPFQPGPYQHTRDLPRRHGLFDLFTQADTEMGILSRPKPSLYPSHLTFYWALFELDCILLTLDHGSDVSSGLPSILATLSTPFLAWEHRFCCAQPAFLHLLHAERIIRGPSSGPSTHRLSCSLPSPPSLCAWPCSRWSPWLQSCCCSLSAQVLPILPSLPV